MALDYGEASHSPFPRPEFMALPVNAKFTDMPSHLDRLWAPQQNQKGPLRNTRGICGMSDLGATPAGPSVTQQASLGVRADPSGSHRVCHRPGMSWGRPGTLITTPPSVRQTALTPADEAPPGPAGPRWDLQGLREPRRELAPGYSPTQLCRHRQQHPLPLGRGLWNDLGTG